MNHSSIRRPGSLIAALLLASGLQCASLPAGAQDVPQRSGVITPTRLVVVFLRIEHQMLEAQQKGDRAALDKLLSDTFLQRSGAAPLAPLPHDEWLDAAQPKQVAGATLGDMAVHEHGELAIASFVIRTASRARFVVDVWQHQGDGDHYQLLTRYVSDLPVAAAPPATKKGTRPAGGSQKPDGKG